MISSRKIIDDDEIRHGAITTMTKMETLGAIIEWEMIRANGSALVMTSGNLNKILWTHDAQNVK